jgi:type VI secretion system activator RovC-like protein
MSQVQLRSKDRGFQTAVRVLMQSPPLDPDVADLAPTDPVLTPYDEKHIVTYLRLLDANADNADWREVARLVLHIDPVAEPDRALRAFESHLARAKWMTSHGYRHLLRRGDDEKME